MATFTLTVSSTLVNVTAGTGTLAQLVVDIGNTARAETVGQVHSFKGQLEVRLQSGVEVNLASGDTWQWSSRTSHLTVLNIYNGAVVNIPENCVFDGDTSFTDGWYGYVSVSGEFNITGTLGNETVVKHLYAIVFTQDGNSSTWIHVFCQDAVYGNYGMINMNSGGNAEKSEHSFSYITFSDSRTGTSSANGTGVYFLQGDWSGCVFDHIIADGQYYALPVANEGVGVFKFANSTFKNSYTYRAEIAQGFRRKYHSNTATTEPYEAGMNQPKVTFDNCSFYNNHSSLRGFTYSTGGVFKFKDCTFGDTVVNDVYGCMLYNLSVGLFEGTTTFHLTSTYKYFAVNGGRAYNVRKLTVSVQDTNGNPVAGAVIRIFENNGYTEETMTTNSNGELKDVFGDDPVFPYRQITNYAGTTFDNWGTYTITVSSQNHQLKTIENVSFASADQTMTITLVPKLGRKLTR